MNTSVLLFLFAVGGMLFGAGFVYALFRWHITSNTSETKRRIIFAIESLDTELVLRTRKMPFNEALLPYSEVIRELERALCEIRDL